MSVKAGTPLDAGNGNEALAQLALFGGSSFLFKPGATRPWMCAMDPALTHSIKRIPGAR